MSEPFPRVFDFERRGGAFKEVRPVIRAFASAEPLRSAVVEELELDPESYRRPLRPEDLAFVKFAKAAQADTVTELPFLAAQRMLLVINEQKTVAWPRSDDQASLREFRAFYDENTRALGAEIAPFLESFAFDFIEPREIGAAMASDLEATFAGIVRADTNAWDSALTRIVDANYLTEGVRFLMIQQRNLAASKHQALTLADAAGSFDWLPASERPTLQEGDAGRALDALAERCGATGGQHAYWQFYLSTSLAGCNLLHALAARPGCALRLIGVAYAAESEWLTFQVAMAKAAKTLGLEADWPALDATVAALPVRFAAALASLQKAGGDWALAEVAAGLEMAKSLAAVVRENLREQLRWLSALERYQQFAHRIDERIQREVPDIDRETFVEPREMCSTTHVHDDHRLVVIESGDMIFWGNVGMTLRLKPGDMVLIPKGRLHGSSIESNECTYHQPIIPDEWIDSLLAEHAN